MNLESLLAKHAPKFINLKHPRKAARGVAYDDQGCAWATDAIQLLRVKAFPEGAVPEVRDLAGKNLDVTPINLSSLVEEYPIVTTLDVLETLEAMKVLQSVLKVAKGVDEVDFSTDDDGNLSIGFDAELVTGSYSAGESEYVERKVALSRFIECLSVFEGYVDRVQLRVDPSKLSNVQLSAPNVDTLLMCIVPEFLA